MATTSRDMLRFVSTAARRPTTVGAIAPSSAGLCARLAAVLPRGGQPTVVELGPGTGATSAAIEQQLPAGGRHLGVECDPGLAAYLRRSQHRMEVVQGDAAELGQLLAEQGVDKVDVIISGLPWALFPLEQQNQILTQITEVLRPDGVFTSFAYLHALPTARAKQFRASLQARFEEVLITSPVWRNAPPALTYVCRRPITD